MHTHKYSKPKEGEVFKFCKCGKRKKAFSVTRLRTKLFNQASNLWKEYAHKRDGAGCMIKKVYPDLKMTHSNIYQVDHFFPRGDKNLFFETSNSTVICSYCNFQKSNGSTESTNVFLALREIVLKREGEDKFMEMCEIHAKREPNRDWMREYYLEKVVAELQEKMGKLCSNS
jgi:hypothetical protein